MPRPDQDPEVLAHYAGLVFKTAARVAGASEMEQEDVQQELWIKVVTALRAYDPTRSRMKRDAYVFACIYNRSKDLLKHGGRKRARGVDLFIEDLAPNSADGNGSRERFERRHLAVDAEQVFEEIETDPVMLPNTLSALEKQIMLLLYFNYSPWEAAAKLGLSRKTVESKIESMRVKLSDFDPCPATVTLAAA